MILMTFDPKLKIGQILKNTDIIDKFQCGNMGGMRRSKSTNTLVLVSDYTKGIYHDKWIGGVLHYTGMGKSGDQDIEWAQNKTLAESSYNGVNVHLFEVIDPGEYIYCGRIELVDKPYVDVQPDENGINRKVWMFPIRPVPDNDVKKPQMFVFSNMDDYKERGKNIDAKYEKMIAEKKTKKNVSNRVQKSTTPIVANPMPGHSVIIPADIVGKDVSHKTFGIGIITAIEGNAIVIFFDIVGEKKVEYGFCIEKKLLEFI